MKQNNKSLSNMQGQSQFKNFFWGMCQSFYSLFIHKHFVVWEPFAEAIKNKMCFEAKTRDRARSRFHRVSVVKTIFALRTLANTAMIIKFFLVRE